MAAMVTAAKKVPPGKDTVGLDRDLSETAGATTTTGAG